MFRGLIDTIIGNLQLSIGNIHIRYEVSSACFCRACMQPRKGHGSGFGSK